MENHDSGIFRKRRSHYYVRYTSSAPGTFVYQIPNTEIKIANSLDGYYVQGKDEKYDTVSDALEMLLKEGPKHPFASGVSLWKTKLETLGVPAEDNYASVVHGGSADVKLFDAILREVDYT
eukprot:TRINITY_DN16499_c0_g1_i1.p1 TRINITY_DN16499_c0_g1~~TRINITY_DN16499_c0_g1_i1.p1  ORF type:complete len:121 (-),score=17.76 TRINITY_DN16499_c0_g1_i1:20-382(-)